jgi:hypothetical protein
MSEDKVFNYLQMMTQVMKSMDRTVSVASFLLEHGKKFEVTDQSFPRLGAFKECFMNSAKLAMEDSSLAYCEGYADGVIPVHHAWCVDKAGRVVDPTWESGQHYFGIKFQLDYVLQVTEDTGYWASVLDNYHQHWPLLTGKDPIAKALAA